MNLARAARLIAGFEGFRDFVYDDTTWPSRAVSSGQCTRQGGQFVVRATGGIATVGYGETDADFIEAHWGGISEPDAFEQLQRRVQGFADGVAGLIDRPMTDHQHEAMTSLAYNIGLGGFRDSTVRRKFNQGDVAAASDAFLLWVKPTSLRDRREAEIAHFDTPDREAPVAGLDHLHPVFAQRVSNACRARGTSVYSGARSSERQRQLYNDYLAGRGNPANPPGTSWHEYGEGIPGGPYALAVDFAEPYPHGEPGLVFPIKGEPWHAQPSEITEAQRVAGADRRLPKATPAPSKEDQLFSPSPVYTVHLVASHSGLLLTSSAAEHGAGVVQRRADGSLNQRWEVWGHDDGTVSLINRAGGFALDRPDYSTEAGTLLQVARTEHNAAQRWAVDEVEQYLARIWAPGTNRLIDMRMRSKDEGAGAQLWYGLKDEEDPRHQRFVFVPTI